MTITSIEPWILRFPSNRLSAERDDEMFELIGVNITADGTTGVGWTFTSDYGGGESVKALLEAVLIPRLIGRDASDIRALTNELRHVTHRLGTGISSMAIAAIDIALWDLLATSRGVSIARLLGQVRDRVPAYGSGKASPSLDVETLVETSVGYIEEGFDAIKLRVGREPGKDVDRLSAVRAAVGDSVRIMCDANERLQLPTALWLGKQLQEHGVYWFEEPLFSGDVTDFQRLRQSLDIPIAAGEHVHSRQEMVNLMRQGAIDIVQPDMCMVGGFTPTMDIGRAAESFGVTVAPHFMTELHIHAAAALPNVAYVEYYPFLDDLLMEKLVVENGEIIVPDRPGHGVRFTPEAWAKYRVA